jgi:pimeloyl-ACP methyl ester carboxylesterase
MRHDIVNASDGERLHVRVSGEGPPVLLLHGWTSSHASWAPLVEPLSRRHLLLRPDARGHGGHVPTITRTPDVARLAADIIDLLDHYGIERVAAVGHSMGALTLWQCIRDFGTARFSHLAFIDQSPKLMTDASWDKGIYGDFDAARSQRLLDELDQDFPEAVLRLIACGLNAKARETYLRDTSGWRVTREALKDIAPAPVIAIWKSLVAADYRDVLARIDIPVLLAYGTASNFYTEATARYVAAHISGSHLSFYAGADHCPHLMQPERFVEEFERLLVAA